MGYLVDGKEYDNHDESLFGVSVWTTKAIPKGVVLFENSHDKHTHATCDCQIVLLSRWQRAKYKVTTWFRRAFRRVKATLSRNNKSK